MPLRQLLLFACLALAGTSTTAAEEGARFSPAEALDLLKAGNRRYQESRPAHPHQSAEHRVTVSDSQHPFAQILACSDSRVAPEIVFDEGLGDLFVVRVAGNIVDDAVKGTLEYGSQHLGSSLIVVMGHSSCGAVTAAVHAEEAHDHVVSLMDAIFPSVLLARRQQGDLIANAVRANVMRSVQQLRDSWPTLQKLYSAKKIAIVGAIYDLRTGKVIWLDD